MKRNPLKHISILVLNEQCNLSTVACIVGAYEIFTEANNFWMQAGKRVRYKIELVSASARQTLSNELCSVHAHTSIHEVAKTDLIIIPSSLVRSYETATKNNRKVIQWIEARYQQGAEVASMCTGVFMLAATGLLLNKACSTHWAVSQNFKALYPEVSLQTDKLITDENGIYTNGGAYSFLHLVIYLIGKYFDRQTAILCSKIFQIDIDRTSQSPFFIFHAQKAHGDQLICEAQAYIEKNMSEKISFEELASKLSVSRRNFDRRFVKATGNTPVEYLQRVKVEMAKSILEKGRKNIFEVMNEVGYSDEKAFREVFKKLTGLSPLDYKAKYNKEAVTFEN